MSAPLTVADAAARATAAAEELTAARQALRAAEERVEVAAIAAEHHRVELLRAEAATASDSLPVGARVRHRDFPAMVGTVMESDGTGLAVSGPSGDTSYGYGPGEWVAL